MYIVKFNCSAPNGATLVCIEYACGMRERREVMPGSVVEMNCVSESAPTAIVFSDDSGLAMFTRTLGPDEVYRVEEPVAPVEEPVAPVEEPVAPVEEPVAPVESPENKLKKLFEPKEK